MSFPKSPFAAATPPERDLERAAIVARFFAHVTRADQVLAEVQQAMRCLDQHARDMLVLHHCLDVTLERAAEWLELPVAVAESRLAQAEAAVASTIPT